MTTATPPYPEPAGATRYVLCLDCDPEGQGVPREPTRDGRCSACGSTSTFSHPLVALRADVKRLAAERDLLLITVAHLAARPGPGDRERFVRRGQPCGCGGRCEAARELPPGDR